MKNHPHLLLVSQHAHGHLNPCIQLALNLIRAGARVTLATTVNGFHKLKLLPPHHNLSLASFSDGHDDEVNAAKTPGYVHDLRRVGSETLADLIHTFSQTGNKVTLLVFTLFLPWAAVVARELHLPSALLLIQTATSFSIYNRFFNSRDGIFVFNKQHFDPSISLKLPGLPLFTQDDLPTFALPTSPYFSDMSSVIQQHLQFLEQNPNTVVLVNTLDGLEPDSMASIPNAMVVGPLVSSSFRGIDRKSSSYYFQWLDSKPDKSVVFASFGSMAVLSETQKEELLHGLIESGRPFLLVLRDAKKDGKLIKEKLGEQGLITDWCLQMEVLRHRAVGCFMTHCGWNSTLESMVAGVGVWGNGVRAEVDEGMVVRRGEIGRCLEVVMDGGDRAEEIKKRVEKWKRVAEESVQDGGSSFVSLKLFVESIG
ncbi:hypothetical protein SSX86_019701 [Deinandra increscens subsp. villosa]|uniref:Glycosyltransferase n=1 Tax=Deinandra increscens subsp. villosa TaxID=3103831 RepID=A0AAP0D0A8_9ASTR